MFYFSDLDLFNAIKGSINGGDILTIASTQTNAMGEVVLGEDGTPLINLLTRADGEVSYARAGAGIMGSFDDYDIKAFWTEDDLYLPLAVMNNVFNCGSMLGLVYLNGCTYTFVGNRLDDTTEDENGMTMADYYYSIEAGERPEALAKLTYNVLCLELDLRYGLKAEHGISESFDDFFVTMGLADKLQSTDGKTFYHGLKELTRSYFSDFHSGVTLSGPYAGVNYTYTPTSYPSSMQNTLNAQAAFNNARVASGLAEKREEEYHEQNYKVSAPYQEIGDTAYVTFDVFYYDGSVSYYADGYWANIEQYIDYDTISLIAYAHRQITREDSPIRKVVLDLSCNGGGAADTAFFVVSWMTGDCKFSTTDPTTTAYYTTVYQADVNLDGRITTDDTLDGRGLELYCLTSANSFSCGNLVPCLFKESGKVVLLGQTSGGGACVVQTSITADGTMFCYSGSRHICTVKNGSYYSVDQGATPDFTISKVSNFYDREWLTQFIANLP